MCIMILMNKFYTTFFKPLLFIILPIKYWRQDTHISSFNVTIVWRSIDI